MHISGIGNSNPFFSLLEVSEKTFGMMNDNSNSDVRVYPMKYTNIPKQTLLVAYAVGFIASYVSILKHFFLNKAGSQANSLVFFTIMDNADRITSL